MALGNNSQGIFLEISNGKICKKVSAPTKSSVQRTNKNGKVVNEEFYDHVEGQITDIKTREHEEYGKSWVVTLVDGDETYKLQMKYSSGYSSAFLKCLPNVNLADPIRIIPKMTVEGEKKKTSLFVIQHGKPLTHFYTKDNPNGLPPMKKVKVKGKETWDDTDMMEFFENMVKNDIVPNLNHDTVPAGAVGEDDNIEDLAF